MEKNERRESVTLVNENQKMFAIFHKPTIEKDSKFPAILVCHGFAGQKTGKHRLYVSLAEELAKKGIGVLRLDFRGCGDSEGEFANTTLIGEVTDALKALEFLNNHPEVDNTKIGIFGRSLGGAIAIMAAKRFGNIKSLCLFVPLFSVVGLKQHLDLQMDLNLLQNPSLKTFVFNGQAVGSVFLKELFFMRIEKELEGLENVPLLHIHGEKDTLINAEHLKNYQLLRASSTAKSEFISLPNSDHDFSYAEERYQAIEKAVSWFKETL